MATTTNVAPLKINYLTQAQYDTALANSQINSNELYFTPDAGVPWSDVTGKPSTATSWPTWAQVLDGANGLAEGSSDLTDNSEILTSYASNNGFADTNAVGKVYKRDAIHMYNYIKGKLDSVYKAKQSAVTTATAGSGTTTTVVSSVTQDAQGVITVTTKSIPTYNNYSHPTGDGNLHVPATSTTNNGKFLKAGSTAGSLSWANVSWSDITSKPLTLTAASTGFTIAGGTTSKTLTVSNSYSLGAACEKAVDTSISAGSTSTNLPTSKAVATFVEGKGYITSAGITSVKIQTTSPLSGGSSTATSSGAGSWSLSLADAYGDTKNPYGTKTANTVLAGPSSGSAAAPAFRALVAADIPDLAASKINSGTFDAARIPSLAASKITSGTFDAARIPSLDASKITSGTFDVARIPALNINNATTGTLKVARGGTGETSFTDDYVIVATTGGSTQTLVNRGLTVTGSAGSDTVISVASGKKLTVKSFANLDLCSAYDSSAAITFKSGNVERGRFNPSGMLQLGDLGTQSTHKLYVNGDSAFNGKLVFGAQASNVITPKADIEYNSTDESIDFVFA